MELKEQLNQQMVALEKQMASLKKVEKLMEAYPDLVERKDRWRNEYYVSESMNPHVNKVEFKHSCGCCPDAPLLAFFYKVIDGIRIYANPFSIGIGENNPSGYGDYPDTNWKETLRKYNIPEHMDEKVQAYFDANPPQDFEDEE